MNAYTKGQNAAITYLNENPTTSKVAFLNASQAQAASLYKSQASITQFIRGFLSLESEYHFATVPASTEPVIVETLTADDGETVETGYIYQEEDDEQEAEAIEEVCGKCYIDAAAQDGLCKECHLEVYGICQDALLEQEVMVAASAITPLQFSLMGFFAAVGMWAVFQEVNAWEVAPADDTDWLHAFQAADEWIAENGHPEGCVCGFCRAVAAVAQDTQMPDYSVEEVDGRLLFKLVQEGIYAQYELLPYGKHEDSDQFIVQPSRWKTNGKKGGLGKNQEAIAHELWGQLKPLMVKELERRGYRWTGFDAQYGFDLYNRPSMEEEEALQIAWNELQAVPSYCERYTLPDEPLPPLSEKQLEEIYAFEVACQEEYEAQQRGEETVPPVADLPADVLQDLRSLYERTEHLAASEEARYEEVVAELERRGYGIKRILITYCPCCQRERSFTPVPDAWECGVCGGCIWQQPAPDEYAYQNWQWEKTRYYSEVL